MKLGNLMSVSGLLAGHVYFKFEWNLKLSIFRADADFRDL